jgi:hypothetical protein
MTIRFFVHSDGLNVRGQPSVNAEIVGSVLHGASVEVERRVVVRADGFVWRRVVSLNEQWIAELHQLTGKRFLRTVSTDDSDDDDLNTNDDVVVEPVDLPTQRLRVVTSRLNVRNAPRLRRAVQVIDGLLRHAVVEVYRDIRQQGEHGWVWRKLKHPEGAWVAEHNVRSGARLLRPVPGGLDISGRVQTDGTRFTLDGESFRFMGANLRELPYYSHGVMPFAAASHVEDQIQAIEAMEMRVVRLYAAHRHVDVAASVELVRDALDRLHQSNLLAIVCLNDALGDSNFYVPGDDEFHTEVSGHLNRVEYFRQEGWRDNFLPFVETFVAELENHPAIFAWELGNEYALHPYPGTTEDGDAFIDFAHTTARRIRELDDQHLITTGLINVIHVTPEGETQTDMAHRLYDTPLIDFGVVHFYQHSPSNSHNPAGQDPLMPLEAERAVIDLQVLKALDKPTVIEEFGSAFDGAIDRQTFTEWHLTRWFNDGVAGFMQWGLSATASDIGVGDNIWGMDRYSSQNSSTYPILFNLYQKWARDIS